nr:aminotransferase class V-fold PLP-dependent enzyme [Saccharopolyspora erythraea]
MRQSDPRDAGASCRGVAAYLDQFDESPGYLDFARFGPPSKAVVDTTAELLARSARADMATVDGLMRGEGRAKAAVARLSGAGLDNVVLLPNTSLGLFQAAFDARGEVLVPEAEFPANTYPWARAEQAGRIRVRWMRPPDGLVTPEAVAAALTPDTTVVSVSAVDFRTGHRADLAALRDVVGDRLLVVDGIQGFGAVREPWEAADVLVAGGQKWLRAGWGTGFAALSDRALERLEPVLSGWTGARAPGIFDDRIHPAAGTAANWSISNLSPVTAGAFAAALELVEDAGVGAIEARIAERLAELEEAVRSSGAEVVSATARRGGILAFAVPGVPSEQVGAALAAGGVTATVRGDHVRLSPHASTGAAAVEAVRTSLATLRSQRTPDGQATVRRGGTAANDASGTATGLLWHGADEGFALSSRPLPRLSGGEVLVRVRMATICGSDLHTIAGHRSTPVPTVLGHEVVGTVVETGGEVRSHAGEVLAPGDRVTWTIGTACGTCARCRGGVPQKCVAVRKYGHEAVTDRWALNGGFATHCHLLAGTGIVRVPEAMPDEVATPANCATATVVCAARRARLAAGDVVVVLGCGMLGLTAVAYARDRGAVAVVACDLDEARREAAREFGADAVCAPAELAEVLDDVSAGGGADVVFEVSGNASAVRSAFGLVGIDGRIALVGSVSPSPEVHFEPSGFVRNLSTLVGSHNYGVGDLAEAVAFLDRVAGRRPFAGLVPVSYPLADYERAIADARGHAAPRVAITTGP